MPVRIWACIEFWLSGSGYLRWGHAESGRDLRVRSGVFPHACRSERQMLLCLRFEPRCNFWDSRLHFVPVPGYGGFPFPAPFLRRDFPLRHVAFQRHDLFPGQGIRSEIRYRRGQFVQAARRSRDRGLPIAGAFLQGNRTMRFDFRNSGVIGPGMGQGGGRLRIRL